MTTGLIGIKIMLLSLVLSVSVNSCSNKSNPATGNSTPAFATPAEKVSWYKVNKQPVATMEKSPCFGTCPVFRAEIFEDGYVYYEGINNVPHQGKFIGEVPAAEIDSLLKEADAVGFFEMKDAYDHPQVTDIPSTTISIRDGKKQQTVLWRYEGPAEFKELEGMFDRVISRIEFTAVPE